MRKKLKFRFESKIQEHDDKISVFKNSTVKLKLCQQTIFLNKILWVFD